jgi:GNAT superfamily N-acetyltransferase
MIRAATPEDVPVIAELIRALAEYERLRQEVILKESDLRDFLFGQRKFAEVLIAEENQEPVGFALFFHNFSTFLAKPGIYLEDLFVRPAYRRNGHGKALLKRLAQIAVERGCGRLEWAVLNWNKPAIDFYHALGAGPLSDWTVFRITGDNLRRLGT